MSLIHCLMACAACFATGYACRGFVRHKLDALKADAEKLKSKL